jgi:1-acyl-sn-glycerol-3-phosphate acyltransferase
MSRIAELWISGNDLNIAVTQKIEWKIQLPPGLSLDRSYLVCANHQSWVDIVVLQHVFNRQIPFLRFFLKQQLLYVPFLGAAWWALDYPFMKRYTRDYLRKHPEKRGEDLRTTMKAIEKFKHSKVSILNFLEGTRFTKAKHDRQASSFQHLLMPKAGGFAFALEAMNEKLHAVLDVTIVYPNGAPSLWGALCGRLDEVVINVREVPPPREFLNGSYLTNAETKAQLHTWVTNLWKQKDSLIGQILLERRK